MSAPQQFRKKPVVIEAIRWDGLVRTAIEFMDCAFSIDDNARRLSPGQGRSWR